MKTLYPLIFIILAGCATNMPTAYHDYVEITAGPHKGERGQLISDCPGFENYKVRLTSGLSVCVRSYNMVKVF